MADPFAILANSRLDVPGLLGAYQQGKQGRMQDMLFQRQIAKDDRDQELSIQRQGVMARLFQPKGTEQRQGAIKGYDLNAKAGGGDQSAAPMDPSAVGAGMGQDMLSQAPQQLMDPRQLPPRTDGIELNQKALAQLYQIDPEGAMKIQNTFYDADKEQIARVQQNGVMMANVAGQLKGIQAPGGDLTARRQALQAMLPQLESLGLNEEQLGQIDLSDGGLDGYVRTGNVLSAITHKPGSMEQNYNFLSGINSEYGAQYAKNQADPIVQMDEYDARSNQYIRRGIPRSQLTGQGAGGAPSGGGPARIQSEAEYNALPPGTPYIDPNGRPKVKGGATPSASGNFP